MTTPAAEDATLDEIRREIDAIDDGIVDLMARRIAASEKVKARKSTAGSLAMSPIRPAREALILRRLVNRGSGTVPPELLVRLWRVILSSSTLAQAPVTIHVSRKLASSMATRLLLRDHFGPMPVEDYRDEVQALLQVNMSPGDLCVVEPESPWADGFAEGQAGEARVIASLPVLKDEKIPAYLILGHAQSQATGDDETIIVSDGRLPRDFIPSPLWQVKSGKRFISCLPGFLSEHEGPLVGLMRSNATLGLKVAGRYPSPIEVR